MPRAVIGLDLGTSSAKALALSEAGGVLAAGSRSYPTHTPAPGLVEHDPEEWWGAACGAVRACLEACPAGTEVVALGPAGHMSALLPLDQRLRPLRRALTIGDARGAEQAERLEEEHGEEIAAATGNLPLAAFTLPKLLWLREREGETYRRARVVVGAKDYLRLRLTGELATEPTDAGNTLLLRLGARDWNERLMERLGVPEGLVPPLVESLGVAGRITPEAAAATGLAVGAPVIAGLSDMAASVLGSGLLHPGPSAITLGTSGQVTRLVEAPDPRLRRGFTYHPHALPGRIFVMASLFTGGLALQWLAESISAVTGGDAEATLRQLLAGAAASPAGARGLLFLPLLTGSGSPAFDPARTAAFLGLRRGHDGRDLARAALEGVAFSVRHCLEALEAAHGRSSELRVGGGGMRSELWRGITAGVLGRPLRPLAVADAGPLGAALAAAHGVGLAPSIEAVLAEAQRPGEAVAPDSADRAAYEEAFGRYLAETAGLPGPA